MVLVKVIGHGRDRPLSSASDALSPALDADWRGLCFVIIEFGLEGSVVVDLRLSGPCGRSGSDLEMQPQTIRVLRLNC